MDTAQIRDILDKIKKVKVGVYGDFCLDAYWMLDPGGSEVSVETGLKAQAVAKQYYTLGGASNIVGNLAALQPAEIHIVGVCGHDVFGRELRRQLEDLRADTTHLIIQDEDFDTIVFGKRYLEGVELERIDFGYLNNRSQQTVDALLAGLRKTLETSDVLIFNQQVPKSINNESFISGVNKLFEEFSNKVILLDSRHYGDRFDNVYRKTNDIEAARLNGVDADLLDVVTLSDIRTYANNLHRRSSKPVFVSRGARGLLALDKEGEYEIPGIQLLKKLDTVGAGDTATSALALCLGAGVSVREAAEFSNFASAVTVQKLFQTGTANGDEILEIGSDADYIYHPELAEDLRSATYHDNTEIELCCPLEEIPLGNIRHAVFDHDGTISTLRHGWESIMEPVMIKAILGPQYESADETLYHKVRRRALDYIDQSTGIQTILQMRALVEMVREFGIVPEERILDEFGYKEIYNEALMDMVNQRLARFTSGRLSLEDYTIKRAVDFLKTLHGRGIKLYLASGTDREDVINEAACLGYADYFEGRIYGSIGDVKKYSKKMVIDQILRENKLSGHELIVFGDGPVELRESRKRGGLAVGIASDEVQRFGINPEKRARVIKAGSHIVIPDFSESGQLLDLLFGS